MNQVDKAFALYADAVKQILDIPLTSPDGKMVLGILYELSAKMDELVGSNNE